MTVEAAICALLGPLVGGRVFPDVAPLSTQQPYITYQQIGGRVIAPLAREVPSTQNGFFQINTWSNRRTDVAALALRIEEAFITATAFVAKPMAAPIASHDSDLNLYGTRQDFTVWSDR